MARRVQTQRSTEVLTVLAALALVAGLFAPMVRIVIWGELSYSEIAGPEQYVVAAFAALAIFLVVARRYDWLWCCALGATLALIWPWFRQWNPRDQQAPEWTGHLETLGRRIEGHVTAQMDAARLDAVREAIQQGQNLEWGLFALAGGLLALWVAAVLGRVRA